MSMLDNLVEMGFSKELAEKALKSTGEQSIEDAINWLTTVQAGDDTEMDTDGHKVVAEQQGDAAAPKAAVVVEEEERSTVELIDDDEPITQSNESSGVVAAAAATVAPIAQSYKCNQCGKLFPDDDAITFHAVKTNHSDFSESTDEFKPMSDEEKRQKLQLLQERIRQQKAIKAERERQESIELEKKRRIEGQQLIAVKQRLRDEELRKIAEEKKREKIEMKRAKDRVLADIQRDREARKIETTGGAATIVNQQQQPTTKPVLTNQQQQHHDKCHLQIRLLNGTTIKQTFGAKEELAAVRLYVQLHRTDGDAPFTLMTSFPKRVFTEEDYEKPLDELGLVPSAALFVTRIV